MNDVREKILKKIETGVVTPRPRWQFVLLHVALWTAVVVSVFFGSIAVAQIIREYAVTEWDLVGRAGREPLNSFFFALPFIWFFFLLVLLVIADLLFKHTKKGYRYGPLIIVGVAVLISVALGSILHVAGASRAFDTALRHQFRAYSDLQEQHEQIYIAPQNGTLAGVIVQVQSGTQFVLHSFSGEEWTIDVDPTTTPPGFMPHVDLHIGVIGTKGDDHIFQAQEIRLLKRWLDRVMQQDEEMREVFERNFERPV